MKNLKNIITIQTFILNIILFLFMISVCSAQEKTSIKKSSSETSKKETLRSAQAKKNNPAHAQTQTSAKKAKTAQTPIPAPAKKITPTPTMPPALTPSPAPTTTPAPTPSPVIEVPPSPTPRPTPALYDSNGNKLSDEEVAAQQNPNDDSGVIKARKPGQPKVKGAKPAQTAPAEQTVKQESVKPTEVPKTSSQAAPQTKRQETPPAKASEPAKNTEPARPAEQSKTSTQGTTAQQQKTAAPANANTQAGEPPLPATTSFKENRGQTTTEKTYSKNGIKTTTRETKETDSAPQKQSNRNENSTNVAPVKNSSDDNQPPVPPEKKMDTTKLVLSKIVFYLPNIVLDTIDVVKLNLGIGPGAGVHVQVTEPIQTGLLMYDVVKIGLNGNRFDYYRREDSIEFGLAYAYYQEGQIKRDNSEVGGVLHLLVIGGEASINLEELGDLIGCIFFCDGKEDDLYFE